jgi:ribosome biogenesis GTPase
LSADTDQLRRLGWSDHFETAFAPHAGDGASPARVVAHDRGSYVVHSAAGEQRAELTGRLRHTAPPGGLPAAGDWVVIRPRSGGGATIHAVVPRRTVFSRKAAWTETVEQVVAANVDVVFVVTTLTEELSPRRLERYLTMAWESGAEPVVVLNKADLCPDPAPFVALVEATAIGVPVELTSAETGDGIESLRPYLGEGRTGALLGSSGVGKSTLVNRLVGSDRQDTRDLRGDGKRGRHTTTRRELVAVPGGGLLLDTPGMRELQLWEAAGGLDAAFADVTSLAAECRFTDCAHETEPGCAVREALDAGSLAPERLESFRKLEREEAMLARRLDKRAQSDARRQRRVFARSRRRTVW